MGKKSFGIVIVIILIIVSTLILTTIKTHSTGSTQSTQTSNESGEDIAIGVAKGIIIHFFSASHYVNVPELEFTYSDIDVALLTEETDSEAGEYKVTGAIEIVNPETKETENYIFEEVIIFYNGAYSAEPPHIELADSPE